YNIQYLGPWIDHFGALAGQNFGGIRGYVEQRSAYVRSKLPAATAFRVTSPASSPALVDATTAVMQGLAGLDLKELVVEGPEDTNRVRWINTTTWQATPVLRLGKNAIRIKGYDSKGAQVVNSEWSLTSTVVGGGLDTDGDGMPDAWERRYALDPSTDDRSLDSDGDGQSNRDEFLAGTDPRDRQSLLRLQWSRSEGRLRLQLDAKAGRSYSLLEASGSEPTSWKRKADIAAQAEDRVAEVIVTPSAGSESALYRLVSPSPP
ncbi:MAG: thrombospondin type 3 repeat-containing protein, partial [Verrucomicrobiota bacterium]